MKTFFTKYNLSRLKTISGIDGKITHFEPTGLGFFIKTSAPDSPTKKARLGHYFNFIFGANSFVPVEFILSNNSRIDPTDIQQNIFKALPSLQKQLTSLFVSINQATNPDTMDKFIIKAINLIKSIDISVIKTNEEIYKLVDFCSAARSGNFDNSAFYEITASSQQINDQIIKHNPNYYFPLENEHIPTTMLLNYFLFNNDATPVDKDIFNKIDKDYFIRFCLINSAPEIPALLINNNFISIDAWDSLSKSWVNNKYLSANADIVSSLLTKNKIDISLKKPSIGNSDKNKI